MEINKIVDNGMLQMSLSGRLDTVTSSAFAEEVNAITSDVKELVLDLSNLEYVSSAGLRVILTAQKKMNIQGSMIVKNANDTIMEIFEITGFIDILNVE